MDPTIRGFEWHPAGERIADDFHRVSAFSLEGNTENADAAACGGVRTRGVGERCRRSSGLASHRRGRSRYHSAITASIGPIGRHWRFVLPREKCPGRRTDGRPPSAVRCSAMDARNASNFFTSLVIGVAFATVSGLSLVLVCVWIFWTFFFGFETFRVVLDFDQYCLVLDWVFIYFYLRFTF